MDSPEPAVSPLIAGFRARGVRLSGLDSDGLIALPVSFGDGSGEQRSVRTGAGLFDFSFMAGVDIRGPGAQPMMRRLQTRDLSRLATGRIAYTLLLRHDGTVLIDATAWRVGPSHYRLMIGRRSDVSHVRGIAAHFDVQIDDWSHGRAAIALQGPCSAQLLRRCGLEALPGYFQFAQARVLGRPCEIARVGYTGELGYELFVDAACAPGIWDGLRDAGEAFGVRECGFEAADALRIEAGFILFSRELAALVTPYEIGLGRLLAAERGFLGAEALASTRGREPPRLLVGLVPTGTHAAALQARYAPAPGTALLTSDAYSALFGRTIGMGFVHPEDRYPGTGVRLQSGAAARVARLPFYDPPKRVPRSPA